jgi:ABC-type transport system substrate-binding protein
MSSMRPDRPARRLAGTWLHRFILLGVALLVFGSAACSIPFLANDEDSTEEVPDQGETPVAVGETPPADEETPSVTVDEESRWTIITGPQREAPAGVPLVDQHLRLAGSLDGPLTLDPALVRDTESAMLSRQVFRGLVRIGASLEPEPDLAQRIEVSPDGLVYRFALHDDITFHDGRPITAHDVEASLVRATDVSLESPTTPLPARHYLADIVGVHQHRGRPHSRDQVESRRGHLS